jgi:PE-PPE domain
MRKSAKALLLVLVAVIGSVGLTIGAAFSAAFAFGATLALIVPGTGTHDVLTATQYRDNAGYRYIDRAGGPTVCTSQTSCNTQGVDYPATFFPLVIFNGWCPGLSCDTWNKSVDTGVTNLNGAIPSALHPDPEHPSVTQDVVIFGYSQGGAVVSEEMIALNNDTSLSQADKNHISVVTIGNIDNPEGLWGRLSFLPTIPGLDISFGPQLPTDEDGIKSTNYSFEYDPVGDAPQYWGNPVAMLNAVAAFEYVHGYYLSPNGNGETDTLPYGYDDGTLGTAIAGVTPKVHGSATFILIPQQGALPIYQPFVDLANTTGTRALVDPVISLIQPVTKVIVNLGYDRAADPGVVQPLSILPANPFQNWFKVGEDLAGATVEGVTNVVDGVDVTKPPTTPPADPALADVDPSNVTALASKQKQTVIDTDTNTVATVKDTPAKTTVTKLKDVTKNRPVATAIKKAADKLGSQVKATVDKVKAAVTKATAPKEKKDATEAKAKDAA